MLGEELMEIPVCVERERGEGGKEGGERREKGRGVGGGER